MISRRSMLFGGAAALSLGGAGLSLARAYPGQPSLGGRPRANGTPKKLILIHSDGGWDVTYGIDPKLHAPEIQGPELDGMGTETTADYGGITIASNQEMRPAVDAFFARWFDKIAVINGMRVDSIAHGGARRRVLSGSRVTGSPDMGAIVGATLGATLPLGYVDAGGMGMFGPLAANAGRIGHSSQLRMLVDRSVAFKATEGSDVQYPQFPLSDTDAGLHDAYMQARLHQLRDAKYDAGAREARLLDDLDVATTRARRLQDAAPQFEAGLKLGKHPDAADLATLTAELLTGEVCQAVLLGGGVSFDTHQDNEDQHGSWNTLFETLSLVAEAIEQAGLWEDTVMVVSSDFARTPKRNADNGKGHWPVGSTIVMGGGVRSGGVVLGGTTDDTQDARRVDFETGLPREDGDVLSYAHVSAGVLSLIGVDPEAWLPGIVPFRAFHA